MLFEIDSDCDESSANINYNYSSEIPVIHSDTSYFEFFRKFMFPNLPCIIQGVTQNWKSSQEWLTEDEKPDLNHLRVKYGTCPVTIYNCNERYFNSQKSELSTLNSYIDHWGEGLKYLKDWHLKNAFKDDDFYQVPIHFASDWLNEYLVEKKKDDYRFVYIGTKGTWTPFHSDVFNSFSWSANVCGTKRWIFLPPGEENKLRDKLNNLPYDLSEKYRTIDHFEIIQNKGDAVFVPSGWYHQVWNLEDTISVNHNWINGCNIKSVWNSINYNLNCVQKEIEDCKNMEDYENHCQVMLEASYGMNFNGFYDFLEFIALKRIDALLKGPGKSIHEHVIGKNHCYFDLLKIYQVLMELEHSPHFSNSNFVKTLVDKIVTCNKIVQCSLDDYI